MKSEAEQRLTRGKKRKQNKDEEWEAILSQGEQIGERKGKEERN